MTLTNRLLLLLIASHAVLLAGFSVAVYAAARAQLYPRLDERTEAALDALAASAESEEDGWEWEPGERRAGRPTGGEAPAWAVSDGAGHRVDGAGEPAAMLEPFGDPADAPDRSRFRARHGGERWRVARRILLQPAAPPAGVESSGVPDKPRYPRLVLVAAVPEAPAESALSALAWSLSGGAATVIALVALGGRWWCRRALAPVARMTDAVKGIGAESLAERVPAPGPRDEIRELAEAFNALLARVQVGYERQARFTAEASHQLRTPLAGMLGQLELALKREREPEEYRRVLAVALGQAGHLNAIVDMLLFLARADGEALVPIREPADLVRVIGAHLEAHWTGHPRRRDIALQTSGAGIPPVPLPIALFGQALHNILENAAKYSAPGTPIAIGVAAVGGAVEVSVRDRGCGIAADELGRIFDPFYRTADAGRSAVRGIGLGLAGPAHRRQFGRIDPRRVRARRREHLHHRPAGGLVLRHPAELGWRWRTSLGIMAANRGGLAVKEKYIVRLSEAERASLAEVVERLSGSSQKVRRAWMLLEADAAGPARTDARIVEAYGCRRQTVENLRERFVTEGFEATRSSTG